MLIERRLFIYVVYVKKKTKLYTHTYTHTDFSEERDDVELVCHAIESINC